MYCAQFFFVNYCIRDNFNYAIPNPSKSVSAEMGGASFTMEETTLSFFCFTAGEDFIETDLFYNIVFFSFRNENFCKYFKIK